MAIGVGADNGNATEDHLGGGDGCGDGWDITGLGTTFGGIFV